MAPTIWQAAPCAAREKQCTKEGYGQWFAITIVTFALKIDVFLTVKVHQVLEKMVDTA